VKGGDALRIGFEKTVDGYANVTLFGPADFAFEVASRFNLRAMPEISRFLGVIIRMHFRDHPPGHFHAHYGDYEITVEIESGHRHWQVSEACAASCGLEWHGSNRAALIENWQRGAKT